MLHRAEQKGYNTEFFKVITGRHSIRAYQSRKIEEWKMRRILDAVSAAPSAGNLQAYEIFVVTDKEKKQHLSEAAYGQAFIAEAPIVLVFASNPSRSSDKYGKRGEELYSIQDATIAASYVQLSAAALGVGSVWIGSFDEKRVLDLLRYENELRPIVIMPLGYPAESPELAPRRNLEDLVHEI